MDSSVPRKNPYQVGRMDQAARALYRLFVELRPWMRRGGSGKAVEAAVLEFCRREGFSAGLRGYHGFPAACCVNRAGVLAHGIPDTRPFEPGELVTVDLVLSREGWHADASWTYGVGTLGPEAAAHRRKSWQRSLQAARVTGPSEYRIARAVAGSHEEDGIWPVSRFAGHGIGREIHEPPRMVYLAGSGSQDPLPSGAVWTVEPCMVNADPDSLGLEQNNRGEWVSYQPVLAAQFELMVALMGNETHILGMPGAWQSLEEPPF